MCSLMLSELSDEQRESLGLPVHEDTEYMGANDLDERRIVDWVRENSDTAADRRRERWENVFFVTLGIVAAGLLWARTQGWL